MKTILSFLAIFLFAFSSRGQIKKGDWLIGGNATFSSSNNKSTTPLGTGSFSEVDLAISPNIGYFVFNKLAAGLKLNFAHQKFHGGDIYNNGVGVASYGYSNINWFDFGVFLRYYLLPMKRNINILSEINYVYGIARYNPGKGNRKDYSAYCGPVVFLTPATGIEFLAGYRSDRETITMNSSNTDANSISINKSFNIAIGLQVHLKR